MLVAGMLSSAVLVTAPGTFDVTDPRRGFLVWMDDVVVLGPVEGYRYNPYDYPPGTKTLLGLAGKVGDAVGISRPNSLKILLLTFQALTALVAFALTGDVLLTGAIWLCTTIGAIGQGYLDVLYAPFLVASIVGLQRNRPCHGLGPLARVLWDQAAAPGAPAVLCGAFDGAVKLEGYRSGRA